MKTIKFLFVCLIFTVKASSAQSSSIDSLLVNFTKEFEKKVNYNEYFNPADSVHSRILNQYIFFREPVNYYAEAYKQNQYFVDKTCVGDTINIDIVLYGKNDYDFIQISLTIREGQLEGVTSIIFHFKNALETRCLAYDKRHASEQELWARTSTTAVEGPKESISFNEFQEEVKNLLQ